MRRRSYIRSVAMTGLLVAEMTVGRALLAADHSATQRPWRVGIAAWWSGQEPLDASAQLAGWIAIAVLAWLMLVTLLHLVAELTTRGRHGRRIARHLTSVATRIGPRWMASAATVTLAGITAGGCTAAPPTAVRGHAVASSSAPVTMVQDAPIAPPVTMVVDAPDEPDEPAGTAIAETPAPAPAQSVEDEERTVQVVRGDNLWSIAERSLTGHLGRSATPAEIAVYWRRLIDLNRSRLVEPTNPDLIHPGQQLLLPPPV